MGNANSAAAANYAQTYGGVGGPAAAGAFPGAAGAFPTAAGGFPGAAGAFPTAAGGFPGAAGAFPATTGAFPTAAGGFPGAFSGVPGVYPSAFPGTVASPAFNGPPIGGPIGSGQPGAPTTAAKKGRGTKESRFLDKEYAERIQAETALAYGNYAGATWHDARADRWGVKADKRHYRAYGKGAIGTPYAFHPIPPAAGIAAVQPGVYAPQQVATRTGGFADAVQVGLLGAPGAGFPGAGFPGATVLPQAGTIANPFYGF